MASLSPGAYIDALNPSTRLSFPEVKELATSLSNTLVKSYGLRPCETVSLFATNSIYYPVAMWAALRVGGRINGASPAYGVDEMVHAMRTAGSKIVFTLPACLEVVVQAAGILGIGKERVVLLEGEVDGVRSLGELVEKGRMLGEVPVAAIPEGKSNRDVCG
jgi:acyl-CoA synthetase (AMP-forming)/AMP-acid ligase II